MRDIKNEAIGCMIGSAIGDALGTTLEFSRRDAHPLVTDIVGGGGVFNLPKGMWTDDTSMSLAIADSLLSSKGFNPKEIQDNFLLWLNEGMYSNDMGCFDIGITTHNALETYEQDKSNPFVGSTDKMSAGNGSIMRLSPIFTYYATNQEEGTRVAVEQSKLTHAHPLCLDYCKRCSEVVYDAFVGKLHEDILAQRKVKRDDVWSDGFVVNTYNASCWAISQTDNFRDALILAVNLAGDADTVGAVTGMFAGALYGLDGIPEEWVKVIALSDEILNTATELFEQGKI